MTTDPEPPPLPIVPRRKHRTVLEGDRFSRMSIEEIEAEVQRRQNFALARRRRRPRTPVHVKLHRRVHHTPDWAWSVFVCLVIVAFVIWAWVTLP